VSPTPVTTDSTISARLFKNPVIEYFSHIHPLTPIVVFVPVIIYFLYHAFATLAAWVVVPLWCLGVAIWTLTEYVAHRFVFHHEFDSKFGKRLHFLWHGVHHDYPNDGTRLVMPLLLSLPLATALFFVYRTAFGALFPAVYAGLVSGYVCYDSMHYAIHHFRMEQPVLRFLKVYHLKHHFQNPDAGFGVSNPLWDYVFGTVPQGKSLTVTDTLPQPDQKAA
jgi:dihydroceramide fatty acyl 2-hydroxylase